MKDPVWSEIVHIEVHTQLHSATRVYVERYQVLLVLCTALNLF